MVSRWKSPTLVFDPGEREPEQIVVETPEGRVMYCISLLPHSVMIDPADGVRAEAEGVIDHPDSITVRFS